MDLKLDNNGDLDLTNGEMSLVTDGERMAQQIRIRLRMFKGEWMLDQRQGMPYLQELFRRPYVEALALARFRTAIQGVPGVQHVENLQLELSATRQLSVSFEAVGDTEAPIVFERFVLP